MAEEWPGAVPAEGATLGGTQWPYRARLAIMGAIRVGYRAARVIADLANDVYGLVDRQDVPYSPQGVNDVCCGASGCWLSYCEGPVRQTTLSCAVWVLSGITSMANGANWCQPGRTSGWNQSVSKRPEGLSA